jgi:hypothetical protein
VKCADLTAEEAQHVRAALRFLRTRCGTWATLAKVLGFAVVTLENSANGHATISAALVFRVARFAKVGIDDVLSGRYPAPGTCPHCGHCPATGDGEVTA